MAKTVQNQIWENLLLIFSKTYGSDSDIHFGELDMIWSPISRYYVAWYYEKLRFYLFSWDLDDHKLIGRQGKLGHYMVTINKMTCVIFFVINLSYYLLLCRGWKVRGSMLGLIRASSIYFRFDLITSLNIIWHLLISKLFLTVSIEYSLTQLNHT